MKKINKLIVLLFIIVNFTNYSLAESNFFEEAKIKYDEKKYEESKFLFQRSIVFNPKDENSYLYLAKIYNFEENKKEEQKNIDTVLLLDPKNEEANGTAFQDDVASERKRTIKVEILIWSFLVAN